MVSGRPTSQSTILQVLDLAAMTDDRGQFMLTLSDIARQCDIHRDTVRIILRRAAASYAEEKLEKNPKLSKID